MSSSSLDALLGGGHVSADAVRAAARTALQEGTLSEDLRPQVWKVLMGTHNQLGSPIAEWDGEVRCASRSRPFTRPTLTPAPARAQLNLSNQEAVHAECQATFAGDAAYGDAAGTVAEDVEKVVTYYCSSRGVPFVAGLNCVVAPFFAMHLPLGDAYNTFYQFLAKFAPMVYVEQPLALQSLFQLFRLLVLYHDPQLCHHLDDALLRPELYARPWLMHLHATNTGRLDVLSRLWDRYLFEGDPLLNFFVSVALLMRARDRLMAETSPDALRTMLSELRIDSVEAVDELWTAAMDVGRETPKSFRKQLFSVYFRPGQLDPVFYANVQMAFCLSISGAELVDAASASAIQYLVIDCRPLEHFQSGRLPTAAHWDPAVVVEQDDLVERVSGFGELAAAGRVHFCFVGTGNDVDDVFMHRIVLEFMKQHFAHVSIAHNGYDGFHDQALARPDGLVDHDAAMCLVCTPLEDRPAAKLSRKEKLLALKAKALEKKEKLQRRLSDAKERRRENKEQRARTKSEVEVDAAADAAAALAPSEEVAVDARLDGPLARGTLVNVQHWASDPDVHMFPCRKIKASAGEPRYLVLSPTYVTALEVHRTRIGLAYVKSHKPFKSLQRITFRKSNPNNLYFEYDSGRTNAYLLQQPRVVTDIVSGFIAREKAELAAAAAAAEQQNDGPDAVPIANLLGE